MGSMKRKMIEWGDVYEVVQAMAPLYVALLLGYASVKWWHMFNADQCAAINRFTCYFIFPFYSFNFVSHIDPFSFDLKYIGADVISNFIIVFGLGLWCKYSIRIDRFGWFVTCCALSTMSNSLFVGVPLINALYGQTGVHLVVQSTIVQIIVYGILFMILLEFWKSLVSSNKTLSVNSNVVPVGVAAEEDFEGHGTTAESSGPLSFWPLMRNALLQLVKNPNIYAIVLGLIWAFIAKWRDIGMPKIVERSVKLMSAGGTSTAMFSLAMPQSLAAFVFANQYGLHADVMRTAVIFGMIICLPVFIAYYAILAYIR